MPDRIEIRGLRALGLIGVNPEERERPQPFEVDFDVELDTAKAGATDDLRDTIDYGRLAVLAEQVVITEPHLLLERVAERIAQVAARRGRSHRGHDRHRAQAAAPGPGRPGDERRDHHEVPVTRALLALGSNLGDRVRFLQDAVALLPDLAAVSPVYETDPVGGPGGQGAYLNMVVRLDTELDARELLELCQRLEEKASRRRIARWGPRTLDVDVLWVDGEIVDEPDLIVPHPRMQDRPFVLAPLRDVAPDLVPDGWEQRFDHLGVSRLGELDELTPLAEA